VSLDQIRFHPEADDEVMGGQVQVKRPDNWSPSSTRSLLAIRSPGLLPALLT